MNFVWRRVIWVGRGPREGSGDVYISVRIYYDCISSHSSIHNRIAPRSFTCGAIADKCHYSVGEKTEKFSYILPTSASAYRAAVNVSLHLCILIGIVPWIVHGQHDRNKCSYTKEEEPGSTPDYQ